MIRRAVFGGILATLALPAPAALAEHPTVNCRFTSASVAVATGRDTWSGAVVGYIVGTPHEPVSVKCVVYVNGFPRASTDVGSGTSVAGTSGRVTYVRAPWETLTLCATYTASHGARERCFDIANAEHTLPAALDPGTEPAAWCNLVAASSGVVTGRNVWEGTAHGYALGNAGESVSVRCIVRIDGVKPPWGGTVWGSGTTMATTADRLWYSMSYGYVELCVQFTTARGPGERCRPAADSHVSAGADDSVEPAVHCGFKALSEPTLMGEGTYQGVAFGYVVSPQGDNVAMRCVVKVNGGVRGATDWGNASASVATTAGPVTFTRTLTEVIQLCAQYVVGPHLRERCFATTTTQLPPQEVIDVLAAVQWEFVDPTLCPVLTSLSGEYGPISIRRGSGWHSDVYVNGTLWWDCPGYEPA